MSLVVHNNGQLIVSTNYWDLPKSKGDAFLTLNAGAFRLLLPDVHRKFLGDLRDAEGCAVTRGPWPDGQQPEALEVLFDDACKDPFALLMGLGSWDHLPLDSDAAKEWVLTVWTRPRRGQPHLALHRPCRYRRADRLPYLKPWDKP